MELKKELGFLDVFCLATGAMVSSGIFILPGIAFQKVGPAMFVSYFLAGLLALTGLFSVVELTSAMPKAGGDYFFATRSLGPLTGTVSGILSWFALSLKTSFAVIGIGEIAFILLGLPLVHTAIVAATLFAILNIFGVEKAGDFEVAIVTVLLVIMSIFIIAGLPNVDMANFQDFAPHGFHSILLTAGFVFVSYGGLLKIATVAEEIQNPKKNIPLALFTSLFVVTIVYGLMLVGTVGTVVPERLSGSLTPISDAAQAFMGTPGFYLLTVAAMLAFISTANAGIMAASRYPLALSKDQVLPPFIGYISPRFHTPVVAIILTTTLICLSVALPLETLVKVASVVVILAYILSNISVVILRESRVQNYRPSFKAPFYPWIQLISIICFSLLILDMGKDVHFISFAMIMAGVLFYFFYGHQNSDREYALLYLIARITNSEVKQDSYMLENELKNIIHNRDDVSLDRFDRIVDEAIVLDIEEAISVDDFFKVIAEKITMKINKDEKDIIINENEKTIYEKLHERENDSSTAITPFTAIPHLIVDGTEHFSLVLVRAQKGLNFSETRNNVKSIFVLCGTRDQRLFHLQALASIAQTILNPQFEKLWMDARDEQGLKDVILLSERKRIVE